jgi:hypothetical protein
LTFSVPLLTWVQIPVLLTRGEEIPTV